MGKTLYSISFVVAIAYALTLGIFIKTGQSVDPFDIVISLFNQFISLLGDPGGLLTNYRNMLAALNIFLMILDIVLIFVAGVSSIFSALFGFFGMLILVLGFSYPVGALFLIIGGSIAILAPDPREN